MNKVKLNKETKAKLLASIASGYIDLDEFPEIKERLAPCPMSKGTAKRIIKELESNNDYNI
ncbi:hypothetical protein [Bacteroides sp. 51]|uniref:hypothetical protein n=1 Tax=Bacteroides sp. 51 TaxID=2302938 RepID=UPI0013D73693|nr:hypothetical protein [Bacteroides sp. 51]NDV82264.1 hypothetical protein [Bacteroides sp. 51]